MKKKLNIYSNQKIKNFLTDFFSQYNLIFMNLDTLNNNAQNTEANIILVNNKREANLINLNKLNDNHLIISCINNNDFIHSNNLKLLKTPISINLIKNRIENLVQNLKIQFHDISIDSKKLTNIKNNSFCYLTEIEFEILSHIIKEKETTKNFIKENILKIKSNIETNSLESHLTRIRKKMNKINTFVKIQTKSEKLLIKI